VLKLEAEAEMPQKLFPPHPYTSICITERITYTKYSVFSCFCVEITDSQELALRDSFLNELVLHLRYYF